MQMPHDVKNINLGLRLNGLRQLLVKRYIAPFRQYTRWLDETQWWSGNDLIQYQNERLRDLLGYVLRNVPFYRQWEHNPAIDPGMVWSIQDLHHLPVLEKQNILQNPQALVAGRYRKSLLYKCHTSGTTGTPLTLYRNLGNIGFEHALIMRQYRWAGIGPKDRVAIFKGDMVPASATQHGKFWVHSPFENRMIFSSYHLSPANLSAYYQALQQYHPAAIDGYPSSIYILAHYLEQQGQTLPLRAVLTSSETLTKTQRATIAKVFACNVYNYYGHAERVAAIHTCEKGGMHIIPEYGIVELHPLDDGKTGRYEIIATGLNNRAMPLVRYRTGDVVTLTTANTCACGRHYPLVDSIEGRMDDYIVTRQGRLIGRLDHIFKGVRHVQQAQIVQPDRDHLVLRIVPDERYGDVDGDAIVHELVRRIGEPIHIDIETVDELERGGRGKLKSVISHVSAFEHAEGEKP